MDAFFASLSFFTSGWGLFFTLAAPAVAVLIWDWRVALAALVAVQFGVATLGVQLLGMDPQLLGAQTLTVVIAALILGLSQLQVRSSRSLRQPGNWLLRLLALLLLVTAWRLVELDLGLPNIPPEVVQSFVWIGVGALLLLGLSDNPLYSSVALLMWMAPVHVVLVAVLPIPSITGILGVVELLLAVVAGYLILADRVPAAATQVATDVTFPDGPRHVSASGAEEFADAFPLPDLDELGLSSGRPDETAQQTDTTDAAPAHNRTRTPLMGGRL